MEVLKKSILFFIIAGSFFSCIKEESGGFLPPDHWSPSYSFPIGRSTLALDEISGVDAALLLLNPLTGYPFWVEEIQVPLNDTLPFSFDAFLEDEVERILVRLNTYNGFPATINGQIYFLDAGNTILDSVFQQGPLNLTAGQVVNQGETVASILETNQAVLDESKIQNIRTVEKVAVIGTLQNLTLDTTLIQYYSSYKLDVQIGAQIWFKFGSEDFSY